MFLLNSYQRTFSYFPGSLSIQLDYQFRLQLSGKSRHFFEKRSDLGSIKANIVVPVRALSIPSWLGNGHESNAPSSA